MYNLAIKIENKVAIRMDDKEIVCGNADYTATFEFDSEWNEITNKTARFKFTQHGQNKHIDANIINNVCNIPPLRNISEVSIGVYAEGLSTSTGAKVKCKKSILCDSGLPDVGFKFVGSSNSRIANVEILADKWVGTSSPYSQVVTVEGITKNSQVNLTPSVEQLAIFYQKDLAFVTENDEGVVTVYAIGDKPANDYTIQATVTEVNV